MLWGEKDDAVKGGPMPSAMQALVFTAVDTLRLETRPLPVLAAPTDAIVRVRLSSICTSDLHICNGSVPRARPGVILGHEFVGEVVEVGGEVHRVRPGQRVAVNVETFCGQCFFCRQGFVNNCEHGGWELGCRIDGCQTEYVRVPFADNGLDPLPDGVDDLSALLVGDVLASGYFGAELAAIRPGDTALVIGAGPVGICAMLCARLFGPARIIAVDRLPERLALAQRMGAADEVILVPDDADTEAVAGRVRDLTGGRGADAVIECAGSAATFALAWQAARPNACVALVALYETAQTLPLPRMYGKNLIFKTGGVDAVHSARLIRLIEEGRLDTRPLITHTFPLRDILTAYDVFAHRRDGCVKCAIVPSTL